MSTEMTTPPAAGPAGPTVPQRADFHPPRYTFTEISTIAKAKNRVGILLYNNIITYIPSHTVRQGFLRAFGAKIGKDTSILRGCQSSTSIRSGSARRAPSGSASCSTHDRASASVTTW